MKQQSQQSEKSLQDIYAPKSICFGCGPSNSQGLQIKSRVVGEELHAHWKPSPHHEAFEGMLNGGIVGALLDCHCNWTAAWQLMQKKSLPAPAPTVTAEYKIRLLKPTPSRETLQIRARVKELQGRKVWVEGELLCSEGLCAKAEGLFIEVPPGHPAYARWSGNENEGDA